MAFNYFKLRCKIKEVFNTEKVFAQQMGLSGASLSAKLNNKVQFSQVEIEKAINCLGIKENEIPLYFFIPKVK